MSHECVSPHAASSRLASRSLPTMAAHSRTRQLVLFFACLLLSFTVLYIFSSSIGIHVGIEEELHQHHRRGQRGKRRRLSGASLHRQRSHDIELDAKRTTHSEGVITLDSEGLAVEVARYTNTTTISKQTKIINGKPTDRSPHPFMARLHWKTPDLSSSTSASFYCGASLITPNILLTAAHCIGSDVYVDMFSVEDDTVKVYEIVDRIIHPQFQREYFGYDYALIKIERPHLDVAVTVRGGSERYWSVMKEHDWKNKPPIMRLHRYATTIQQSKSNIGSTVDCKSLDENKVENVTTLIVLGYGRTSFPHGPTSHSLQKADVHYISNKQCNAKYLKAPPNTVSSKMHNEIITEMMMCAVDTEEKQDACSGDSGGSLLAQLPITTNNGNDERIWSQVGIVSWGLGCALQYPGVYSRVAHETDWIERTICGDGHGIAGLSPLSCLVDGISGQRHLRDYALEALSKRSTRRLVDAEVDRQLVMSNKNIVDNADPIVCELLEGTPRTTIPTAILSTPKPKPTNQPTKRQINPTFTATKPGLLSSVNVQSSSLCSNNSHYDVKYFKTDRNRIRNCLWVSRKCWKRCVDFAECCPQSCSTNKCQR